jgi:predicted glycoside hydrolase/deacetylase ChbG (UPF0249 family)
MPGVRRLIINADDFGLSEGVNRGIVEAHEAGSVTSASLLVNLPAFGDAVDRAARNPQLGIGLHFNLTAGTPVCAPDAVPSLCDSRGEFHSLRRLVARALSGRIAAADVARECGAQILRLRQAGIAVTHLDSHRHVHLLPGLWGPVVETARQAGIGCVRVPLERLGGRTPLGALAEQTLLRSAYRLGGGNGTRPVDHFYGSALFKRPDFLRGLLELIDQMEPGVTELMVHPGYDDGHIGRWDSYTRGRESELRALTDPALRRRLRRARIELTHFGARRAGRSHGRPLPAPAAPRISLVIPAFNEATYLPRLLKSVAAARAAYSSDPQAVEVILADNGSNDGTADIARAWGCRVVSEPRRVIGAVRNTGAAAARGNLLAFVDADSEIHTNTFTAIEQALTPHFVGGATGVTMDRWSIAIGISYAVLRLWCRASGWDTGVVFCRRDDFKAVGGFDESVLFAEDLAFFKALRRLGRARGQKFARLRGVRTVTSTRKFQEFGNVRWPLENVRVIWLAGLRSPRAREFIQHYWYRVRT